MISKEILLYMGHPLLEVDIHVHIFQNQTLNHEYNLLQILQTSTD